MPSPSQYLSKRLGGRVVPWLTYYRLARQIVDHAWGGWSSLTGDERRELARILRASRGRPLSVPPADRRRVRDLVFKAARGAISRGPRKK